MRRCYAFMLTSSTSYGCKHCGQWQRIRSFKWLALLDCWLHEQSCKDVKP